MIGILSIYSKSDNWIVQSLFNFAAYEYKLEGCRNASFEAFLQSMKFMEAEVQQKVLRISEKEAKQADVGQAWEQTGWFYWNGQGYRRNSREKLPIHPIGRYRHTVLTVPEFCGILMRKRRQLLQQMRKIREVHNYERYLC